jgi:hypothetical protein
LGADRKVEGSTDFGQAEEKMVLVEELAVGSIDFELGEEEAVVES